MDALTPRGRFASTNAMEMRVTKVVPTDKARQGKEGRPVLYVLVAALVLAMGAWAIAELYGEKIDGASRDQVPATTSAPAAPAPAAN